MINKYGSVLIVLILFHCHLVISQNIKDERLLSIERIFSDEFEEEKEEKIQWISNGDAFVTIEKSVGETVADELVLYQSRTLDKSKLVSAKMLKSFNGPDSIEGFSLSPDGSKVLIFTNSSRVWRANTKGDYWVYDLNNRILKQIGASFDSSSLMFAKFSSDNQYVYYVHRFNIYQEHFKSGEIKQLTFDGDGGIINGTFDWAYEEEFGKRDGFVLSPDDEHLAFWRLDARETGIFYMIDNLSSVYSKPIPLQYPKVGETPSSAKIGILNLAKGGTHWVPLEGDHRENYIPGIQWVNEDLLLIQQLNRHQNQLTVWSYKPSSRTISKVYTENEETWVELLYPDVSASGWDNNDLTLVDAGSAFLRMTENDAWRHIYKVDISNGSQTLITPFDYDVASMPGNTNEHVYFIASPENSTQRYLYRCDLDGQANVERITPEAFGGLNTYNISPNGQFASHIHRSTSTARSASLISLPEHKTLKVLADNKDYSEKLESLTLPEIKFTEVSTKEGIDIDVRMILPPGFDESKKYPVLFHVYGEPWGQVAVDAPVGLWNIMMAQKGYVIIDMDNRGTPCLKGSAWRKSIYRKIGVINTRDQALAAKEILKLDYLDNDRTCVWGWSGGGSMTLNLLFKYPETYKSGIAIAAVSNQLLYDNIYQERYMGLPQENMEDFINGSPITYAKDLEGNLLLIHGTADDNVHYQSAELLIDELIRQNKQFQMMAYPNRSHSIKERTNTRKHLYTLMTNYILETTPPD